MKKLTTLLCFTLTLLTTISCGLVEMEEAAVVTTPVEMHLDRDTIYVMKGESFTLTPVFEPQVSMADIYWATDADTVVSISDNTFTAVGEGWTWVRGTSVSQQKTDSCCVCVIPPFGHKMPVYPYETVIYASTSMKGIDFDPQTMMVTAYLSRELCGIGKVYEAKGIKYIEMRAGTTTFNPQDDSFPDIRFYIYDTKNHTRHTVSQTVPFDGEAHGSLTSLISFTVK